eukprot:6996269-Prymnesium_polylepis.1
MDEEAARSCARPAQCLYHPCHRRGLENPCHRSLCPCPRRAVEEVRRTAETVSAGVDPIAERWPRVERQPR